ncbi:MAG: ubiquitin-like domain-containing protein [Chloroflexi bacterium]|nr:ubiquitin-like domain-containing protein [Chloroflexota bacterium]
MSNGASPPEPTDSEAYLVTVLHQHGIGSLRAPLPLLRSVLALGVVVLLAGGLAQQRVTIEFVGERRDAVTLQRQPEAILRDLGIAWQPGDRIEQGETLVLRSGRPVVVESDGMVHRLRAVVDRPTEAARAAGITLDLHDRVVHPEPPRPLALARTSEVRHLAEVPPPSRRAPSGEGERYRVLRAVPLVVHDGGLTQVVWTTSTTVGEALVAGGFDLVAADRLIPPPATPVQAGLHVYLERARAVTIAVDGRLVPTRSRAPSVAALLQQEGILLAAHDRVEPALDAPLDGGVVRVVRVQQTLLTFAEPILPPVVYRDTDALPLGQTAVLEPGAPGVRKWTTRVVSENGREVGREVVASWTEQPATPRVIGRGTRLVYATVLGEQGEPLAYWAKLRVYATAYTAASAGKPKGSPGYGITATGQRAGRGIIAVDPRYLPYGTRLYVPSYGIGVAADTGGGLQGAHIDLCFDDDEPISWGARFVEVYLLDPPPPLERIRHLFGDE